MPNPETEVIHQSLKRCHQHSDFIRIFYDEFLDDAPHIQAKFADTDMNRQIMMVEASLYTCILAADDVPYAVRSIRDLGRMHHGMGIGSEYYDAWLDSLIAAVRRCDEQFDERLESIWRDVMRESIAMMLAAGDAQDAS